MKTGLRRGRAHEVRERLWREWCFARVVILRFRLRLLFMLAIVMGGGALFVWLEPEKKHSLPQAAYYAWSLVFGQPPEEFPASPVLQALFFVIPILGLTVIIEGIVDFALILRDRQRSEQGWCKMMADSLKNHVILVGLGKLGFRTYRHLRDLGETVVVIESDAESEFLDVVRRDGAPFFIGDARREKLLEDANVVRAKSIILATDDDIANLETALDARRIAPEIRVVLRMFDQNIADKVRDGFNIHVAMSQSAISAPAFATAAIDETIINSFVIGDRLIVSQRYAVRPEGPLAGRTIGESIALHGFGVLLWRGQDKPAAFFPSPDVRLAPGDEIVIQGPFEALRSFKKRWD